ncbi:unnamed protein product [Rangifer tarandus platyrhynchus]|uniref:Uncharacterized protein n=1 Tax=Rangifer tarandus platyrhynchus TaxID=3082113 RepID=A0AC59Z796_RANTA
MSTTQQAGRGEAPGVSRWLQSHAVGARSCCSPCSGWWARGQCASSTHVPGGRALSWVRAWIHPVPPQGSPLEEEDAGGTAFVCPPALSLGHSSSQEEGSGLPWWLVAKIPPSNAGG